jgi:uncharacterized protein
MSLLLDDSHRALVRRILDAELPDAEVFVFGSRATGQARPFSDLDLLVQRPVHLSLDQQARLRDAFETSVLPFRVDIVERSGLAPAFAERVERERQPLA